MLQALVRNLRATAIETYLLALFPALFTATVLLFHGELHNRIDGDFLRASMYYVFFGWSFLMDAAIVVYLYVTARLALYGGLLVRNTVDKDYPSPTPQDHRRALEVGISIAYIFVTFGIGLLSAMIIAFGVYLADPYMVEGASQTVMELDKTIYGSYVAYALHALFPGEFFSTLFLKAYMMLASALSVVFIGLLIFDQQKFRQFIATFILIPILSSLIWFVMPVVSPSEMYRRDIFERPAPPHIAAYISPSLLHIHPSVEQFLDRIEPQKSDVDKGYFADTAYPSMHVAWGALVTYYAILLWRPLALVFVPWQILNMIGAVYSLQHYAIDTLLGLLIMVIGTFIVRAAFHAEARWLKPPKMLHAALDVIWHDVRWTAHTAADTMRWAKRFVFSRSWHRQSTDPDLK